MRFCRWTDRPRRWARNRARTARERHFRFAVVSARAARIARSHRTTALRLLRRRRMLRDHGQLPGELRGLCSSRAGRGRNHRIAATLGRARKVRPHEIPARSSCRSPPPLCRCIDRTVWCDYARWRRVPRRLWSFSRKAAGLSFAAIRSPCRLGRGPARLRDTSRCWTKPARSPRCSQRIPGRSPG